VTAETGRGQGGQPSSGPQETASAPSLRPPEAPLLRRRFGCARQAWMRRTSCREADRNLKKRPCGIDPIPSGKGELPAGSESCVVREQSRLRSVDSEHAGRVIEPRNGEVARADIVHKMEGNIAAGRVGVAPEQLSESGDLVGVLERGTCADGRPGTWETPSSPATAGTAE
jgi:hypothetical protein